MVVVLREGDTGGGAEFRRHGLATIISRRQVPKEELSANSAWRPTGIHPYLCTTSYFRTASVQDANIPFSLIPHHLQSSGSTLLDN